MTFINQKVVQLMNLRIKNEELSSRLYKSMSVWLNYNGYTGAAKLWDSYSKEEQLHAEKAYNYLLDLDIMPEIPTLESPKKDFSGLVDIIKQSYDHEILITNQCNDLAKAALQESDFMTLQLAQEYLKEQQDEIAKTCGWLDKLEAFGTDKIALRLLDNEMGNL